MKRLILFLLLFQTNSYCFSQDTLIQIKKIDSNIHNSLVSGKAKNKNGIPFIKLPNGKLKILGFRMWSSFEVGKLVEVYGNIEESGTKGIYNIRNCVPRLVRLKDQVGMIVKLRGKAISTNGYWWFNYRGTDLYVENMEKLPNWTVNNHFRPMEITGLLEQAVLPRIDQIVLKEKRDAKLYYIIRNASWTPLKALLPIEEYPDKD